MKRTWSTPLQRAERQKAGVDDQQRRPLAFGHLRHDDIAADAQQLRDRHDREAFAAQAIDHARQRRDRSGCGRRRCRAAGRRGPRRCVPCRACSRRSDRRRGLPVAGVDADPDRVVAAGAREDERLDLIGRFRFHVLGVRRAEQQRAPAEPRLEQPLGRVQLQPELLLRDRARNQGA